MIGASLHKGMLYAACVLAASAYDLMSRPDVLARAQAEFREATAGEPYVPAARLLEGLG